MASKKVLQIIFGRRATCFLTRPDLLISVGGGAGTGGCSSPKLGRNPCHSGKLSERTIGNLGRKLTESVQPSKFDVLLRQWTCYLEAKCAKYPVAKKR